MRILLLTNKSPWPPRDGGSSSTWNLIKGLIGEKVQVTLVALNTSKHFVNTNNIPEEYKSKVNFHLVPVDTGINPVRLLINLMFSKKPYSLERFESKKISDELTGVLKDKFDIIQVEGLAMASCLPLIRKLNPAKVVYRSHNIEHAIWQQLADEESNKGKKWYYRVLASRTRNTELKIINDFDALVTFTENDMNWFLASGLSKPSLINPPGIIPVSTVSAIATKGSVFFIGALDWRPNINGLRWFIDDVWPLIIKEMPYASFNIAGRNASQKLSRKLKGSAFIYHGEVDSSVEFIAGKCVMVVPLFSGSGIRMKILEGMSSGKCIVSTPLAAAGINCEDKKDIFLANNAKTFAESVLKLLKDDDLRRKTGEYAIENVRKNYNTLAAAENLLKFYSELT